MAGVDNGLRAAACLAHAQAVRAHAREQRITITTPACAHAAGHAPPCRARAPPSRAPRTRHTHHLEGGQPQGLLVRAPGAPLLQASSPPPCPPSSPSPPALPLLYRLASGITTWSML